MKDVSLQTYHNTAVRFSTILYKPADYNILSEHTKLNGGL